MLVKGAQTRCYWHMTSCHTTRHDCLIPLDVYHGSLQIVLVCLYSTPSHYHHCANFSECIELINACQIYFVECVSKINHILSVIHYTICGAVCFQFTHFLRDDWENIYNLSYYHHQIGSMNYYPLFRVRSWNNGVRCMSFYILMNLWYGRIASWDIRVLVVFAPTLALCHWHAALLPYRKYKDYLYGRC